MPGQPPDNTTPFFGVPERLAGLIVRYYDAELSEQQQAELREGLTQHAAARDLFVRWGLQIQTLSESLAPGYSEVDEPMPFAELNELAQMEANAQAQLVTLHDLGGSRFNVKRYAIAGAIAAVLVLAITLSFVFSGTGKAPQVADNTNTPSEPGPVGPALTNPVATLTATHNAQWDSQPAEDLRRGSKLHPNQRLTLTAGFAEITTNDGAVAIIEAPATIELLNNDNAIHLHAGKLVGICETESSKGFVVRTPHLDITDLGTRFGVDATNADTTQVHVLEGEVQVARPSRQGDAPKAETLTQGQGLITYAGREGLQPVAAEPARFASIMPQQIDLFGSGRGMVTGETDPNWRVTAMDGRRLTTPAFMIVGIAPTGGTKGTPANDAATSQWINGNHIIVKRTDKEARFTCRTRFDLPAGIDPESARLVMHFDADDRIDEVRINGRAITPDPHSYTDDHVELNTLVIPGSFIKDSNTLELDVIDLVRGGGGTWGIRVQARLEMLNTSAQ